MLNILPVIVLLKNVFTIIFQNLLYQTTKFVILILIWIRFEMIAYFGDKSVTGADKTFSFCLLPMNNFLVTLNNDRWIPFLDASCRKNKEISKLVIQVLVFSYSSVFSVQKTSITVNLDLVLHVCFTIHHSNRMLYRMILHRAWQATLEY